MRWFAQKGIPAMHINDLFERDKRLSRAAMKFCKAIQTETPDGPEQQNALSAVREAMRLAMMAQPKQPNVCVEPIEETGDDGED
jgi:hypothetical protein